MKPMQAASTITRRHVLKGASSLALGALLPGCGGAASTTASSAPSNNTNPQPAPTGALTQASVTVTASAAGAIGAAFAGLSYEKSALYENPYLFNGTNSNLIGMFKRLGTGVLRIGGNSVDRNVWNASGAGHTSGQIAPADVAALAAFVKATGWQCIYGINLGGSATGATTPALAAAEVAYAAQQFGTSLLGVEIGNECDLYGNTGGYYAGNWTLTMFESLWSQYRSAIAAAAPGVAFTGSASSYRLYWTVPFGQTMTSSELSLLTHHYYRGDGTSPTSTAALLISADPTLVSTCSTLNAGAAGSGIPYRMAECNSFYNSGASGVSNSYASSLWVIDFLFNCAQGGAGGVNLHGGGNGTGYTPIADSAGQVVQARPEFYGILLFTLAGAGTLYQTAVSAGTLNVTAYTVKSASGGLKLILINKDSTQNVQAVVSLPQTVNTATLLEMTQLTTGNTGPSLAATSGVTIQGASVNADGTFTPGTPYTLAAGSSQVTCYVPALSAVLLQLSS